MTSTHRQHDHQNGSTTTATSPDRRLPDSPGMREDAQTSLTWLGTLTVLVTATIGSGSALASPVMESEPNDTLATAQNIDGAFSLDFTPLIQDGSGTNTSTTIPHAEIIGGGSGSLTPDYYSFNVREAGLSGVFDVDFAGSFGSDTSLYLFDSAGNLLVENDDSSVMDLGSFSLLDPFLEYTFAAAGTYIIGVGGASSSGADGGIVGPGPGSSDTYALNATVAVPEPISGVLFCTGIAGLAYCRRRKRSGQETCQSADLSCE